MVERKKDYIHWTDWLFVPASFALSLVLTRWLTRSLAIVLSFLIVTLVLFLFEPREGSPKRFVVAMILGALVTYILTLVHWPG